MTDKELHREEWIAERAALILEGDKFLKPERARARAVLMWIAYQREQKASKTAQEPAK